MTNWEAIYGPRESVKLTSFGGAAYFYRIDTIVRTKKTGSSRSGATKARGSLAITRFLFSSAHLECRRTVARWTPRTSQSRAADVIGYQPVSL
jgi:hypothetical protein